MTVRDKTRRLTLGWRKVLVGLGCAGVAVAGACVAAETVKPGSILVARAPAAPEPEPEPTAPPPSAEYSSSYVATFAEGRQGITREELGEYLIGRYGEKVEHLINQRIMEDACRARGIEVTAAEVNQKLAEDLKDLNIDRARFVREFLKARHMTEFEWKEDHLHPQLLMTKLCRDRLTVSEEEVRNAYEAAYGEKVECRVIEWSKGDDDRPEADRELEARAAYERAARDEAAFAEAARKQKSAALAAGGGRVKPFGRHTLEREELERHAFALRPGEVSPLIRVPDGFVAIKCDRRIPANTSVPFEKVRGELAKDVLERKAQKEFPKLFAELQAEAHPKRLLERKPGDEEPPYGYVRDAQLGLAKTRLVATLYDGRTALTREDLGEYLIQRYGAANLELLVNKRIIDNACRAANVIVTEADVEADFLADCAKNEAIDKARKKSLSEAAVAALLRETPRARFVREVLAPNKTSVYQYKEDVVRPRLQLARLCGDRVQVTEQDLQMAFEAHHGPKVECRMILWPKSEEYSKVVLQEYAKLRDDPKAFDEKAATQLSPTLREKGGELGRPIARHTTGNEALENEAFRLREGEVSSVIETPDGLVVLKCIRHLPAEPVKLEARRDELVREIIEKKTQAEMPVFFAELRAQAQPRLLLRDTGKGEDLADEVARELSR
jgi:parvulin-like peptidyl-prolyl isomerase